MTKRNWQLISAVVVLAACLPLPAAAEVQGAERCATASWSALAAGECGLDELHVLRPPHQAKEDASTDLVDFADEIPEPETYALMLVGLLAVMVAVRQRRRL